MSSLLQQLENNEAILLMYLADELPEEDRLEVEAMLQTDAGLAAELDRLRAVHERVSEAIAALDRADSLPRSAPAIRRVHQAMAQWVEQRERDAASVDQRRRGFPWWGYPIAAAAAVGIILLIWWNALPTDPAAMPVGGLAGIVDSPGDSTSTDADDPVTEMAATLMEEGLLREELATLRQTEQALHELQSLALDAPAGDEDSL